MKFRKKPVVIEAEQYFVGKETKGVFVTNPEIIFSRSGKHFYITHTDCTDWLSVEKSEDGKHEALPFAFYEVKSGERKPIQEEPELTELYLKAFDLKKPVPYAWVETIHKGQKVEIKDGDWIIPEPDGIHYYPCKDEIFKETYDPID